MLNYNNKKYLTAMSLESQEERVELKKYLKKKGWWFCEFGKTT